jgi:ADP-heptose:LPS heptosyltransferase
VKTGWEAAERVLCVRMDTIGDVLMTGPAIRALREARAGRSITLLTSPSGALAARLMPEVDDAIVYGAPWMKGHDPPGETRVVEALRERRFDAAVIFTVFSQSALPAALVCHQAGIPLRLAHSREKPYALLTDWVPEPEPDHPERHEVRRQLDLVRTIGAATADERLRLEVPEHARDAVRDLIPQEGPWAVVHPGGALCGRVWGVRRRRRLGLSLDSVRN